MIAVVIFFMPTCLLLEAKENADPGREKKSESLKEVKDERYRIAVGDTINVTVYQEKDLSDAFEVKEDGTISYPLLGRVYVERLTKSEVEEKITSLLGKDYLVNPQVYVSIGSYTKRQVLLLGHVSKPGTYEFPEGKNLTLMELITEAGGFTGYASPGGTKIVRSLPDGDKKSVIDPHVNDIMNGRKKDVELQPGDLVTVPERLF